MSDLVFDLVIIGAGPGGYVAAIQGAQHGLKTALIERAEVGGVCLHRGCIPTKTMLASIDLLRQTRQAGAFGLTVPKVETSLAAIVDRRQKVVQQLAQGVRHLLQKNQVELIPGRGRLKSASEIEIYDAKGQRQREISRPGAIVLATGSRPATLPHAPPDGRVILTSSEVLSLREVPETLVIIGGGYIGCEFASIFAPLGSRVTIIEALGRLLPNMDPDLGQALERAFSKAGIRVLLNARVAKAQAGDGATVILADGQAVHGAKALVAAGRIPNVEDLGLEDAGVRYTRQGVTVNEFLQTNVPHIYAIGDVTGKMALAHVASAQGRIVVDNLVAQGRRPALTNQADHGDGSPGGLGLRVMSYEAVPACVFTHPEIATVGLTEGEAAQRGLAARVSRFPFMAVGKAQAMGEPEGFVKLVAEAQNGRLIGGHILGQHASELIAPVALAVQCGLTAPQLADTIFAHPTLSEAIQESAAGVMGQSTHIFVRR